VKTIAAVIGVPAIRPEIAANASSVSATTATAQCTAELFHQRQPPPSHLRHADWAIHWRRLSRLRREAAARARVARSAPRRPSSVTRSSNRLGVRRHGRTLLFPATRPPLTALARQLRASEYAREADLSGLERRTNRGAKYAEPRATPGIPPIQASRGGRTRTCNPRSWRLGRFGSGGAFPPPVRQSARQLLRRSCSVGRRASEGTDGVVYGAFASRTPFRPALKARVPSPPRLGVASACTRLRCGSQALSAVPLIECIVPLVDAELVLTRR
jgi:hypothetical protein